MGQISLQKTKFPQNAVPKFHTFSRHDSATDFPFQKPKLLAWVYTCQSMCMYCVCNIFVASIGGGWVLGIVKMTFFFLFIFIIIIIIIF